MRITAAAAGETATFDLAEGVEPTGPGLISARTLTGSTLTEKAQKLTATQSLTLPPGVFTDRDFARPSNYPVYAHFLQKGVKVLGSGVGASTVTVDPDTLSQALSVLDPVKWPRIEDQPKDTGNNFYYLARFDAATEIAGITFLGTPQLVNPRTGKPYSYNGISLYGAAPRYVHDVAIVGVPGTEGVPPEETFALQAYRVAGSLRLERVLVDGLNNGSSALTWTTADPNLDVAYTDVTVRGVPNGAGCTQFNQTCRSITLTDFRVNGCLVGINFEQIKAANGIKIVRPDIRNWGQGTSSYRSAYSHLSIESQGFSNRVDIYDPVGVDASHPFGVTISSTYGYSVFVPKGPQAQRGADVHLWVAGVERPDLIRWMRTKGAA